MNIDKKYSFDRTEHYLRVILPDAIDMEDSDELLALIDGELRGQNELLVIDLVKTTMIYSSGFGLLIRLRKLLSENSGSVAIVNVTPKIDSFFSEFNLEKVFKIYATDIEFELDHDHIWQSNSPAKDNPFIFVAQKEHGYYRITISGHLTTVNDLTTMINFEINSDIKNYIINFENMDTIDTYGAQVCNDFVGKISKCDGICTVYGLDSMASILFDLFSNLKDLTICKTEHDALEKVSN